MKIKVMTADVDVWWAAMGSVVLISRAQIETAVLSGVTPSNLTMSVPESSSHVHGPASTASASHAVVIPPLTVEEEGSLASALGTYRRAWLLTFASERQHYLHAHHE